VFFVGYGLEARSGLFSAETILPTVVQWKGARARKKISRLVAIIKFMKQVRQLKNLKKGWSKS
jgi:hypothetical protein